MKKICANCKHYTAQVLWCNQQGKLKSSDESCFDFYSQIPDSTISLESEEIETLITTLNISLQHLEEEDREIVEKLIQKIMKEVLWDSH